MRVGGLDVLCAGLRGQTFKDFELVFSDALYDYRPNIAERFAEACVEPHPVDRRSRYSLNIADHDVPFVHVKPRDHRFPLNTYCRVMNEGLVAAHGDIVLLVTDYTWLPPDLIERHVRFHDAHGPKAGLMGPHRYARLPSLGFQFSPHGKLGPYKQDETARYVSDVTEGRLDGAMFSIFSEP